MTAGVSIHPRRRSAWPLGLAVLAALSALLGFAGLGRAEVRIALVVGEQNYEHASRLPNTANDAALIAETLKSVGFTVTYPKHDLDKAGLETALKTFARDSQGADVAVVYYAGHGLEFGGVNYLVPTDANLTTDSDVSFEAVPLDLVLNAVSGARRLKMVLLDACRDNPFLPSMKMTSGSRSIQRGLARIEPAGDTLVAYAAKAGSTAADGAAGDSPFSLALAHNLVKPGLEIRLLMGVVRDEVVEETGHKQEPAIYGSLGGEPFYFVPPVMTPPPVLAPPPPQASSAPDPKTLDLAFWESVRGSSDIADYKAYLEQFPSGVFAAIARNKIAAMSVAARSTVASGPTAPDSASSRTASAPVPAAPKPQPPRASTRLAADASSSPPAKPSPSPQAVPHGEEPLQSLVKSIASAVNPNTSKNTPNKDALRGMTDTPALITAIGLRCTPTDARYLGSLSEQAQAGSNTGKQTIDGYEVACSEGSGYILLNQKPKPVALECLATASNATLACHLPANSAPKTQLAVYIAEAARACAVSDAKYLGETATGLRYFEVACQGRNGYVLSKESDKPATSVPCVGLNKTKLACTLTTAEQNLAWARGLTHDLTGICQPQTIRYIGLTKANENAFEASCGADGYIFTVNGSDRVVQAIDCALADNLLEGCKLTTAEAAAGAERQRLSQAAVAAGFGCDVERFRMIGTVSGGGIMVELACSNRPDGAVGVFYNEVGRNSLYDCIQINSFDQRCELGTSLEKAYQKLSNLLAARGKPGCAVSRARYIGETASGDELIETVCAGGAPGWVIEVASHTYDARNVVRCASVKGAASCAFAENKRP
jgi:hypothetical protein